MTTRDELKSKIMDVARQQKRPLTEAEFAERCDHSIAANVKGKAGFTALFASVLESLVRAGELKLEPRCPDFKPKYVLGDRSAKSIAQIGAPVTVWRDPSVIAPEYARPLPKTQPRDAGANVVTIELPQALKVSAAAAAKGIAQPTAVTRVRATTEEVNARINRAWNDYIEAGQPFSRSTVCVTAGIGGGMPKRRKMARAMDAAIDRMAASGWRTEVMAHYKDVPLNPDRAMAEPAIEVAEPVAVVCPDVEAELAALRAENEALKARSAVEVSPVDALVEQVKSLDVELNSLNSEALALGAKIQERENKRTALMTAIRVLQGEGK